MDFFLCVLRSAVEPACQVFHFSYYIFQSRTSADLLFLCQDFLLFVCFKFFFPAVENFWNAVLKSLSDRFDNCFLIARWLFFLVQFDFLVLGVISNWFD